MQASVSVLLPGAGEVVPLHQRRHRVGSAASCMQMGTYRCEEDDTGSGVLRWLAVSTSHFGGLGVGNGEQQLTGVWVMVQSGEGTEACSPHREPPATEENERLTPASACQVHHKIRNSKQ